MSLLKRPATKSDAKSGDEAPTQHDTTDVEDIQLLSDEIVTLCQTSAYDDMTWAEIDNALALASHKVKLIIAEHGQLAPVA